MNTLYCSECLSRLSHDDAERGVCAACANAAKRSPRGLDQQSKAKGVLGALIALIALVSGCASTPPEFKAYSDAFAAEASSRGLDPKIVSAVGKVNVVYADLELPRIADCSPGTHASRATVRVDKGYWATLSPASREELVFHELGHCLLHREHAESGIPSIMQPALMAPAAYSAGRARFVDELFVSKRAAR